jgi:hypothetical protein
MSLSLCWQGLPCCAGWGAVGIRPKRPGKLPAKVKPCRRNCPAFHRVSGRIPEPRGALRKKTGSRMIFFLQWQNRGHRSASDAVRTCLWPPALRPKGLRNDVKRSGNPVRGFSGGFFLVAGSFDRFVNLGPSPF